MVKLLAWVLLPIVAAFAIPGFGSRSKGTDAGGTEGRTVVVAVEPSSAMRPIEPVRVRPGDHVRIEWTDPDLLDPSRTRVSAEVEGGRKVARAEGVRHLIRPGSEGSAFTATFTLDREGKARAVLTVEGPNDAGAKPSRVRVECPIVVDPAA